MMTMSSKKRCVVPTLRTVALRAQDLTLLTSSRTIRTYIRTSESSASKAQTSRRQQKTMLLSKRTNTTRSSRDLRPSFSRTVERQARNSTGRSPQRLPQSLLSASRMRKDPRLAVLVAAMSTLGINAKSRTMSSSRGSTQAQRKRLSIGPSFAPYRSKKSVLTASASSF